MKPEVKMKPTMVFLPNFGPRILTPIIVKGILKAKAINPTGVPRVWCNTMDNP